MDGSAKTDEAFTYALFKQSSLRGAGRRNSSHDVYVTERPLAVDDVVELNEGAFVVADVHLPSGGHKGSAFVRSVERRDLVQELHARLTGDRKLLR